jgi:beta-lactamase regulating signal transducer with metallopeptidase domain
VPEGLHLLGGAGGSALAALVEVGLVKAGLVLGLAGAGLLALRRSSAGARHLVLAVALGALLVLPAGVLLLPGWQIVPTSAGAPRTAGDGATSALPLAANPATPAPSTDAARARATRPAVASPPSTASGTSLRIPTGAWIVAAWLCGALAVLSRFALGCVRLARMSRRAGAPTAPLCSRVARLARELGIARRVTDSLSTEVAVPLTWGLRRPLVLLPANAARWPEARVEAVLAHELAHVRRHDTATQGMAQLACAIYWFNPLVWLAARRLRAERERACDDRVLGLGLRPAAYASELLQIARAGLARREPRAAAVAMARRSGLERRIVAILDPDRRRRAPSRATLVAAGVGALALAAPLAALAARAPAAAGRAGTVFRPSLPSAPNTQAGARIARGFLEGIARHTPQLPGEGPPAIPDPASARVVFSTMTRYGEYTIWRARNKDSRGATTIYSSPRMGMAASSGDPPIPPAPYLVLVSGAASPPLKAREVWARASESVVRVQAVLKDGSRLKAILKHGWVLFAQDFGHPKVVALVGYDRGGHIIARTPGRVF